MASETVDPVDWSHPRPSWAAPPELLRAQYKSVQPLPGIDLSTFSMRGNHIAYAGTQGIHVKQLTATCVNIQCVNSIQVKDLTAKCASVC